MAVSTYNWRPQITVDAGPDLKPRVTALADGTYLVSYIDGTAIKGKIFNADGSPKNATELFFGAQDALITALNDGNFLVIGINPSTGKASASVWSSGTATTPASRVSSSIVDVGTNITAAVQLEDGRVVITSKTGTTVYAVNSFKNLQTSVGENTGVSFNQPGAFLAAPPKPAIILPPARLPLPTTLLLVRSKFTFGPRSARPWAWVRSPWPAVIKSATCMARP
jgi:hypothetical protein